MSEINFVQVDRYWFITLTTYGTWLPGDERGFVGFGPNDAGEWVLHNQPGTPLALPNAEQREQAGTRQRFPSFQLSFAQAKELFRQFEETAEHRGWLLVAVAIMRTHLHLLVGVSGDPDPQHIRGSFKAWGTRRLRSLWPREEYWTTGGSNRKLPTDRAVECTVAYIRGQPNPWIIWTREEGFLVPAKGLD